MVYPKFLLGRSTFRWSGDEGAGMEVGVNPQTIDEITGNLLDGGEASPQQIAR